MTGDDGLVSGALRWLNDPLTWTSPGGLVDLTGEHLRLTVVPVLLAAAVALPVALALGHLARGARTVETVANASRALPTLALLTLFAAAGLFGDSSAVLALAIFAVPPILSNTLTGMTGVDPAARDAARGMGLGPWRMLWQVELPLALPLVGAGLRTAAVQVVATVPLAAYVGGGGLGVVIRRAMETRHFDRVLGAVLVVVALCFLVEAVLAAAQWVATPAPMRARRSAGRRRRNAGAEASVSGV